MYRISDIARLFGVSEKTLRLYEVYGLLSPSRRGESNNYRHYDHRAMLRLDMIHNLKQLGLSLDEIKRHFNGEAVLLEKLAELKEKRALLDKIIVRIECLNAEGLARCRLSERPIEYCLKRDVCVADHDELTARVWELFDYAVKSKLTLVSDHKISVEHPKSPYFADGEMINATLCLSLSEPCDEAVIIPPHLEAGVLFYADCAQTALEMYALLDEYARENGLEIAGKYRDFYLSHIKARGNDGSMPLVHLTVPVVRK